MPTNSIIQNPSEGNLLRSRIIYGVLVALILFDLFPVAREVYQEGRGQSSASASTTHPTTTSSRAAVTPSRPGPTSQTGGDETPAPATAARPTGAATSQPYEPTDAEMAEWRHVPPGQEEHYKAYQRRVEEQREMQRRAQEDPTGDKAMAASFAKEAAEQQRQAVAARHDRWQSLHDAYVTQVKARIAAATTDQQKGQIRTDIEKWQAMNPEPPKPTEATPSK